MTERTSKESADKRRRSSQAVLFRVFVITLIPVTVSGAIFLFLSAYLFLRGAPFLQLRYVDIEGNKHISDKEIISTIELEGEPNILSIDIGTLNEKLAQHPWIERATMRRVFPDGIRIEVLEREPVAVAKFKDEFYFVDRNGVIFDKAIKEDRKKYPLLTGPERESIERGDRKTILLLQRAIDLIEMTRRVKIFRQNAISQIHLDRAVGLYMFMAGKETEIRMGFADFERKFRRLTKIWDTIQSMEIVSIDCTIPDKIIIEQKR
jgi:cell division protein FtsQ